MKYKSLWAAAAVAALMGGSALAQTVGLGTSPAGSFYHTQGTVIAAAVSEHSGLQMRIQPFSSPGVFLPAINGGELEFGLANVYETFVGVVGQLHFEGKAMPKLRLVSTTSPLRVAYFVRKDSPIKTLAGLKGKRVVSGFAQQKIIGPLADAHFAAAGLKESDIQPVPVPTVVRGADDFAAGRADAFFFALGSGKVGEVDAAVGGVRALPLQDTPQARAAVRKHVPPAHIRMEQPGPGLVGIVEPTPVLAYDGVMVTGAEVAEDVVYKVTKVMYDRAQALSKQTPSLELLTQKGMAKDTPDPVKYHPGAVKFYTEKGMWPPKEQ
jgi:TRAP transporter TAXI family solute receptor